MAKESVISRAMLRIIAKVYIIMLSVYGSACSAERPATGSFPEFWSSFRQAVVQEDYSALQSYSKLPLELHGVHDAQPVRHITDEEFPEVFKRVLEQPVLKYKGATLIETTLIETIEKKDSLDKEVWEGREHVDVEQFMFQKVDGTWMLVRAYLE
jgi:hypothetical protein